MTEAYDLTAMTENKREAPKLLMSSVDRSTTQKRIACSPSANMYDDDGYKLLVFCVIIIIRQIRVHMLWPQLKCVYICWRLLFKTKPNNSISLRRAIYAFVERIADV